MSKQVPFSITLFGIIGGILIAIVFGANEDYIKDSIQNGLTENAKIQAITDLNEKESVLKSEAEKNWRYYQRYHFHSTGMGALALAMLIYSSTLMAPAFFVSVTQYLLALGGFFYPFVWLFAGMYGPVMGRSEAKEAFRFLGYTGGLFLVGAMLLFYLSVRYKSKLVQSN